jgi:hypothetical protein
MAAEAVIAPQTAAFSTSGDITIAAGESVTVGVYSDEAGGIPAGEVVRFFVNTPSVDNQEFTLPSANGADGWKYQRVIGGPCTIYGVKKATTRKIGVFKDTGA